MAHLLGRRVGLVSIRPGHDYNGICFTGRPELRKTDELRFGPLVLQPARLRRFVETEVMISLAGPMAALYLMPPRNGYIGTDPDEERAGRLTRTLVQGTLTRHESTKLANAEASEDHETDEQRAEALSKALADQTAGLYHAFLEAETRALVQGSPFMRLVDALVPVLLDCEVLSARAVKAVFNHAEGR